MNKKVRAGVVTAGMGMLGFFIPAVANTKRDIKPFNPPVAEPSPALNS